MLKFLDMIRTRGAGSDVTQTAATIIVTEFKQDLREMGIVTNSALIDGTLTELGIFWICVVPTTDSKHPLCS